MKQTLRISTLAILIFTIVIGCSTKKTPADMIIRGGTIYTAEELTPTVEAIAVIDGKIVFAGAAKDIANYEGENTKVIDLNGKTLTPGFIEGHGHFFGVGYFEMDLDLTKAKNYDEIVEMVRVAAEKAQPGQWILGRGWHQDKWNKQPDDMVKGFQTHQKLSAVSPDNPVALEHASGHAVQVNAKAMEIAGVNQLSKESLQNVSSEGGEIIRDKNGNPTGIFNELATGLIYKYMPTADDDRDKQAISLATQACLRNGITSFHDAGATKRNIEFFREAKKDGSLGVRLYVMLSGDDKVMVNEWLANGPEIDSLNWLTIRSIKLYCDGALGSRGAWLLEPYTDRLDFYGMPTLPMDTVLSVSRKALKAGFQVCSHAIGDRANREILDRYEIAFKENPTVTDHRFRIEHAQHISVPDIARFGKLGVIPAMQAIHMSSDRPWAIDRLGEKRIKEGAYMWQSLLKSGAHIVNGTDVPVEPINPIASFFASVTRQTLKGEPAGGYEPEEKMTRAQALKSYTLDAAYGAFEENIKGSIAVGKLADFTVFTKDLMTIADSEILSTEVAMTIVGGKVMYEKK
jgi:predicted amidohydrolase YtcJ